MPKKDSKESDEEEMGNEENTSISKKKQYPFGTPSMMNPVFSQFSHLSQVDRSFATSLGISNGVEAKIFERKEEKSKKKKSDQKKPKEDKKKKKKEKDEENPDENDDAIDIVPDMEGMEPCTRPLCIKVLEKIAELQQNNSDERDELEEEYDDLQTTIDEVQKEASLANNKLQEVSEITKHLEITYEAMILKAEGLEKSKEIMQQDRTEINSKILTLELEKRKLANNLEQTKKMLADAMWRKQKQTSKSSQENGQRPSSMISNNSIVQASEESVKKSMNMHRTTYNKNVNSATLDETEYDPKVKTMSFYLREKLIYEPDQFDKYSSAFYDKLMQSCNQSREGQDDLLLKFLDRRENKLKYSGIEAQSKRDNVSRASTASSVRDKTAENNFKSLSVELSGGPTLFYYDPDGSRAMRSISSAKSSQRFRSTMLDGGPSMSSTLMSGSVRYNESIKSGMKSPGGRLEPLKMGEAGFDGGSTITDVSTYEADTAIHDIGGSITTADNFGSPKSISSRNGPPLDPVFLKDVARAGWGRKHKLGKVRKVKMTVPRETKSGEISPVRGHPSNVKSMNTVFATSKSMGSGEPSIAWRSKLLTTQHPGMDSFNESLTMQSLTNDEWG